MLKESNLQSDHVSARPPAPVGSCKSNQAGASDAPRERRSIRMIYLLQQMKSRSAYLSKKASASPLTTNTICFQSDFVRFLAPVGERDPLRRYYPRGECRGSWSLLRSIIDPRERPIQRPERSEVMRFFSVGRVLLSGGA